MASGKIHWRRSKRLALTLAVCGSAIGAYYRIPLAGLALGAGAMLGAVVSPDMDVDRMHIGRRKLINRNRPLGWLFWLYWWPYAKLTPHRSRTSHAPILSTLRRFAYLSAPAALIALSLGQAPILVLIASQPEFWLLLAGQILVDLLHIWDDGLLL